MAKKYQEIFDQQTMKVDNTHFHECTFNHCTLIYAGDALQLEACDFNDCFWLCEGSASNTLSFLSDLYAMGYREMVESVFNEIRTGQARPSEPRPLH